MTDISKEQMQAGMYRALMGKTSKARLLLNMSKVCEVMHEWPRSEQLDTIGAIYGLLFSELQEFLFEDANNETQEFYESLEEAFMGFLASRITMDVSARLFKDKLMIFKAHLIEKHIDRNNLPELPLQNTFVDDTTSAKHNGKR